MIDCVLLCFYDSVQLQLLSLVALVLLLYRGSVTHDIDMAFLSVYPTRIDECTHRQAYYTIVVGPSL